MMKINSESVLFFMGLPMHLKYKENSAFRGHLQQSHSNHYSDCLIIQGFCARTKTFAPTLKPQIPIIKS